MRIIETHNLKPGTLDPHTKLQVYNGLDSALTVEIFGAVAGSNNENLSPATKLIYDFERAMQAPALEMMLRGWKIDLFERDKAVAGLKRDKEKVQEILDEFAMIIWDRGLNAGSYKQKAEFFYDRLKLPEQFRFDRGVRKVTTNREALEKLLDYFYPKPFVHCILKLQELTKKISVLSSDTDRFGRMHTSYNVTGTETGRWSSSKSVFDEGNNLQNITEELRIIFVADRGKKLAYVDLSQAESRALGFVIWKLFGDTAYLDACESGDLHVAVAKLVWPRLPWTGDPKIDIEIAERKFYLHFSYRDLAKRGGHATNYYGTPPTVARHLKVRTEIIRSFQNQYFAAFPGITEYHRWVARSIGTKQYLETPLGMGRHFFGRPDDDATLREGIAFIPQSVVGQLLNLALWRIWRHVPKAEILGQIHDAVVIQYDEGDEAEVLPQVLKLMATPLEAQGRTMVIPSDIAVGWNWSKYNEDPKKGRLNPDGIKKWAGAGSDTRQRRIDPDSNGLDRLVS